MEMFEYFLNMLVVFGHVIQVDEYIIQIVKIVDGRLYFSFSFFILLFFSFSFNFLFLEQLGLEVISHAVTT